MGLITLISCKNDKAKISQNIIPNLDFVQTYSGKINDKYPFHMKITSNNGTVTGNYFYDKVGKDIELKGSISIDSVVTLNEFDKKGNQTGLWKGKLINLNKIEGDWSKPSGSSSQKFSLLKTSETYKSVKRDIYDSKFSRYSGSYNSPFNDGGISFGKLVIKYTNNGEINFNIRTAHQSGCTGELKGTAKINEIGIASYSGLGCENVTFKFTKDQVSIKEKDCNQHGMRCYFSGIYKK